MLVGTLQPLQPKDWSYGNDARTPSIKLDGELHWVKWNLKHIDTVSWDSSNGHSSLATFGSSRAFAYNTVIRWPLG
jgi:hypothetical protein